MIKTSIYLYDRFMVKVNYILDAKNIGENYFDILNYKILKADHKHQRNGMTAMVVFFKKIGKSDHEHHWYGENGKI